MDNWLFDGDLSEDSKDFGEVWDFHLEDEEGENVS
jgi:hypothetical protein